MHPEDRAVRSLLYNTTQCMSYGVNAGGPDSPRCRQPQPLMPLPCLVPLGPHSFSDWPAYTRASFNNNCSSIAAY